MSTPTQTRRRSRIAHFKAPFVVAVVTTASLASGCGGVVDEPELSVNPPELTINPPPSPIEVEERDDKSTGATDTTDIEPTYNPPEPLVVRECEPTPTAGSACDATAVDCGDACGNGNYRCENGIWKVYYSGCNPPAPEVFTTPDIIFCADVPGVTADCLDPGVDGGVAAAVNTELDASDAGEDNSIADAGVPLEADAG